MYLCMYVLFNILLGYPFYILTHNNIYTHIYLHIYLYFYFLDNKGLISNLSKRQQKLKGDKIKKVCDLILNKLKKLENVNKLIKYTIILKYGNKDNKKEMIQTLKNEEGLSDDFKNNLSNYETEQNNDDIKEIELVNFISTNYDKFVVNLEDLNKELLKDLNMALS